ncbi:MAG TPA: hypothetical protein VN625_06590, partial [Desulfuromonadaceae bacterium]|nr:hypothetical protein [Desulfuromonadaceae bacterium]
EGNGHLNGVGQNAKGNAFLSLAFDAEQLNGRRFAVVAVTKAGRTLPTSRSWQGSGNGQGVRTEEFVCDAPLAEISRFIIGTRPIHTNEWKNVLAP